jgi:hypothetical protein
MNGAQIVAAIRLELSQMEERLATGILAALRSERPQPEPATTSAQAKLIRTMDARKMLGGRGVLDRVVRAGWIAPVRQGKRMTLFRRKDILAALQRIEWGELS